MGAAQSAYLSVSHHQNEVRKKRAEKLANSKRGQRLMKSSRMQKYIAKREKELGRGAEIRRQQEEDTTKGEQVWFSRCILNGRLRHWVLITHGTKYELRRADHIKSSTRQQQNSQESEYVCNIQPFTIDQARREASLTEQLIPEIDGYYVCLIGWTHQTKSQVDAFAREVLSSFGSYNLLRNNCQDFLRRLAERILIGPKAADHPWFVSNTKTAYQKDQWLKPPPSEMLMRWLQASNAQMMQQTQMQNQLQNQMQNQLQNQMQTQIQNQIQLQIQNQIQMQMQNQIMMQSQMQMGAAGG